MQPAGDLAAFLGGFVVAEGCFTRVGERRFAFTLGLGSRDRELCEALPGQFGVGRVHTHRRRQPHYQDEVTYAVGSLADLVEVIVPFMDEHLPPSYKREQYLVWREALLDYWNAKARRPR